MATFTWKAGTSADWSVTGDWALTGGTVTAPPGSITKQTDTAAFGGSTSAYTVKIAATDQTYDLATVSVTGLGTATKTSLDISGSLLTNKLAYIGSGNDALVTVDNGGLLDIRNTLFASLSETLTIAGTGSGGHLELGSASNSGLGLFANNVTVDIQRQFG